MAMTIVETTCSVTAGVDTHADVDVAAVVDHVGGVIGIETFATDAVGCRRLVGWLHSHGDINLVGVEGTGSYGAGLTKHLTRAAITTCAPMTSHTSGRRSGEARWRHGLLTSRSSRASRTTGGEWR